MNNSSADASCVPRMVAGSSHFESVSLSGLEFEWIPNRGD